MAQTGGIDSDALKAVFTDGIPHVAELGIELVSAEGGTAILRLPYQDRLVGNVETGVLAGGVVTTLIDTACGMAAITAQDPPMPVATIDLRIDYTRPAEPGRDVQCRAVCYKMTHHVAFLDASAYEDDPDDPVATAAGTFIIQRGGRRRGKAQG